MLSHDHWPTILRATCAAVTLAGCGGDPVQSPGGEDPWWRYRINGGQPVVDSSGTVPVSITIDQQEVNLTDRGTRRVTTSTGAIGVPGIDAAGTVKVRIEETLRPGSPSALTEIKLEIDERFTLDMEQFIVQIEQLERPQLPIVQFLERPDLNELPDGFSEEAKVTMNVTGSLTTDVSGQHTIDSLDDQVNLTLKWTVREKLPSFAVLGKEYRQVVRLEESSVGVSGSTGATTDTTSTVWVAKGVGVVRSLDDGTAGPMTATELVETNQKGP
jgi:hypothetical protein